MNDRISDARFTITLTGALFIFLGAAILSNAGDVTRFVVRLAGFACATVGAMIFLGRLLNARMSDAIPFGELALAGLLLLLGMTLLLFPHIFEKLLFSALGVLIILSGLGDIMRSREKTANEEGEEKAALRMGIGLVAVGAFVTLVPSAAVHIVPVVCGIALVVDGLAELFVALEMEGPSDGMQ